MAGESLFRNLEIEAFRAGITPRTKQSIEWFRKNWDELDLIDPQKFAIFPGDVVVIVNKSHSKSYNGSY